MSIQYEHNQRYWILQAVNRYGHNVSDWSEDYLNRVVRTVIDLGMERNIIRNMLANDGDGELPLNEHDLNYRAGFNQYGVSIADWSHDVKIQVAARAKQIQERYGHVFCGIVSDDSDNQGDRVDAADSTDSADSGDGGPSEDETAPN